MTPRFLTSFSGAAFCLSVAAVITLSLSRPATSQQGAPGAAVADIQQARATEALAAAAAAAQAAGIALRDVEWVDTTRQRTLPVRLYLPKAVQLASQSASQSASQPASQPAAPNAPAASTKLPLVVFSHGLGGSRLGYAHFGRHFAQNGFIALHVQHPGSDRAVWSGGPFAILGNVQAAASEANVIGRAQDVSFALDRLLADQELGPLIDRTEIAVAGHSYGANTAMLLAGAAVERNGKRVSFADARIRAAILLSAPPFHGEGDQAAALRDVRVPTLHITGTDDVIRVPGYRSDAADRIGVFRDMPATPAAAKHLAIFEGGEHSVFTDRTRSDQALAIKAAARDLSLAFLLSAFRGQPDTLGNALAAARPMLVTPEQVMARRFENEIRSTAN